MKNTLFVSFLLLSFVAFCQSSTVKNYISNLKIDTIVYGPDTVHARGIQLFKDKIYTANSNGHVYRFDLETNKSSQLTNYPFVELRDIHIFDEQSFVAMQSAESSNIVYKTDTNTSVTFYLNVFLDGLAINESNYGLMMGDPKASFLQVFVRDKNEWILLNDSLFKVKDGEAGFAASGTTIEVLNDSTYYFVTGGKDSHLFKTFSYGRKWERLDIPFDKSEASGPFSTHFWSTKEGIVVGGDYLKPNDTINNCFLTKDGGKTWTKPNKTTLGYRSCVIQSGKVLYACGSNGIDCSIDFGLNWYKLSDLNTFSMTSGSGVIYATTKKGRIVCFKAYK